MSASDLTRTALTSFRRDGTGDWVRINRSAAGGLIAGFGSSSTPHLRILDLAFKGGQWRRGKGQGGPRDQFGPIL